MFFLSGFFYHRKRFILHVKVSSLIALIPFSLSPFVVSQKHIPLVLLIDDDNVDDWSLLTTLSPLKVSECKTFLWFIKLLQVFLIDDYLFIIKLMIIIIIIDKCNNWFLVCAK